MSRLSVRLLGGFGLERDGEVISLTSSRAQAALAYLLLHRDRSHERRWLASILWPDTDERQARTNLRQALHQLRRTVPDVERSFVLDGQHLRVREEAPLDLDVARFEGAAAPRPPTDDSAITRSERDRLEDAIRHYRGDLLPEMGDDWLDEPRAHLLERFASVLERIVVVAEAQQDYGVALQYAQRWAQHDPLVEEPYRRLMRLHALRGERAKAMHVYHTCASLLMREVGGEPSPRTQAAYEQAMLLDLDGVPDVVPAADVARPGLPGDARRLEATADAGRRAASADAGRRAASASTASFVGRAHEQARLRTAWEQALAGRPGLAFVSGDSGIGKSALVEAFVRSLPRGKASVASTRCYGAEGPLAFAPVAALLRGPALSATLGELAPLWRRELRRLLPEVGDQRGPPPEPLTEPWQRTRLFEAMARPVLARQPIVLVIDDLQWCDRETLEWLRFLLRFDASARLLVVAAARSHEIDDNAALAELLAEVRREGRVCECEVGPLSEAETATLGRRLWPVEPSPGRLADLFEQSEGVPLFVVELLRGGGMAQLDAPASSESARSARLPPRLRAVIEARLSQLPAASAELASVAAVIGREFDFELLVKVRRQGEDAVLKDLDELWRRRIVREVGAGEYDFSHDRLREVAYALLSLTRRRFLHRRAAEALEAMTAGGSDEVSRQIAHHYDLAELPERAIPYYRRAAEAARALYAHEEAVTAYERALALLERLPGTRSGTGESNAIARRLLEGIGDVRELQGLHEVARERFGAALQHVGEEAFVDRARLHRKIGETLGSQRRYAEAFAAFDLAEQTLGEERAQAGEAWWRERIDIGLARSFAHQWQGELDASERVLRSLEDPLRRYGTPVERGRWLVILAMVVTNRDGWVYSEEAVAMLRAALKEAEERATVTFGVAARFLLGASLLWHDERGDVQPERMAEARAHLEQALVECEAAGEVVIRVSCLASLGFMHRVTGDLEATRAFALRTLEAATALGMPEYAGAAHGNLAWLAWRSGDHATCEREGLAALTSWQSGWPHPLQWVARLPLMAVRLRQGRLDEALAYAAPLLEPGRQRLPVPLWEALAAAVQAGEDGPGTKRAALERVLVAAQEVRRL